LKSLLSQLPEGSPIVYVDSGSTDGSCEAARQLGIAVLPLDSSLPFTAARARNAGFACLQEKQPNIEYVQFIDGDCELASNWIGKAKAQLKSQSQIAAVCGRRREKFQEISLYNRLCDLEWNTPVGEAKYCGGDVLMRVSAFAEVGGFNPALIAGEEPELCVRLRQQEWKIYRIDAEMTLHDAQMLHFRQWWRRSVRNGHAHAEGAWLHGKPPERHWVKESLSIWFWGLILPLLILSLMGITKDWSLLLLGSYPLLAYRIYRRKVKQGLTAGDASLYALFCVLGKFPGIQGQIQFHLSRLLGKKPQLIEYKS
jgi:glycosyltransferase involved in cell wall biosynthesis